MLGLLLSGCTKYLSVVELDTWVGRSKSEIERGWGKNHDETANTLVYHRTGKIKAKQGKEVKEATTDVALAQAPTPEIDLKVTITFIFDEKGRVESWDIKYAKDDEFHK